MSDIAALVADNLNVWTGAIERKSGAGRGGGKRISLYGIDRLRALILDLAVRGKLVPQEAEDEPASELLQKFKHQHATWISSKRIRKGKPLETLSANECSFPAPIGWRWTRLGNLGDWGAGATPNRKVTSYYGGEIPWFKSGELVGDYISASEETVTEIALKECSLRLNAPGDVLVAMYGATIGKTSILEIEATTNQAICACTPFFGVHNAYLLLLLKAMRRDFISQGAGGAQPNISREKIIATPLCLPPLAEQQRIVAKVDKLMGLCDALEQESAEAMAAHQALVEILLAALVNSADATDLARGWARLESHFDTLFTTDASIDAVKQTILELAVRGKLVTHDARDEPAKLAKKVEKETGSSFDILAALGAPLPRNWIAAPLEYLTSPMDSGWSPACHEYCSESDDVWGVLKTTAVQNMRFEAEQNKALPSKLQPRESAETYEGDVLITRAGPTNRVGICCFVKATRPRLMISDKIIRFRPISSVVDGEFLALAVSVGPAARQMEKAKSGMAASQVNISQSKLKAIVIPIPPLAEQHRIVAKVNALMALCDALKARLADAARTQRHLADAITQRAAA